MEKYLSDSTRPGFARLNDMAPPSFAARPMGSVGPPPAAGVGAYNAVNPFTGDPFIPVGTGLDIGGLNLDTSSAAANGSMLSCHFLSYLNSFNWIYAGLKK